MIVKTLTTVAMGAGLYKKGSIIDLSDQEGNYLISNGMAEKFEPNSLEKEEKIKATTKELKPKAKTK